MQRAMLLFIAIMVTVLLPAATKEPQTYRNEEFGITLPVPEGTVLCPTPKGEHDHGAAILLGTNGGKACSDLAHGRRIDIFAGPNASYVTKELRDYLKWECTYGVKSPCLPAPGNLEIAGLPSMAGRMNHPDGWIDIVVVTQAGKPDPAFDASVPSLNYDLSLHTTSAHLKDDLPIFREVLKTIKLSPTP
jgi:hypothetical protein